MSTSSADALAFPGWQPEECHERALSGPHSAKVVVDLGCGTRKTPGSIGVDIQKLPGVDLVLDLDQFPYPFANGSVDEVHLKHVLEHLPDVMGIMEEVWRVLKPGGTVQIRVPHFTGTLAWKDPTHRRSFTSESFGYFGENGYSFYTHARFRVASVRLNHRVRQDRRGLMRLLGRAVQWFIDRHPTFGERHLAYLVGGIDEIQCTLEAVKPAPEVFTGAQPCGHSAASQ